MPISLVLLRSGFLGAVLEDRDSWLLVPVIIGDFRETQAGLHYFNFSLFERNENGIITRNVINFGKEADFLNFVLLLPLLKSEKYIPTPNISWTMVGSEYERLGPDGTLQTVYNLPINLRNQETNIMSIEMVSNVIEEHTGAREMNDEFDELYEQYGIAQI